VKVAAIIDRDQSTVYSVKDGNREFVTIIEASALMEWHFSPRSFFRVCIAILNGAGLRRIHLMLGMLL
jgi:hypothetical protein